MSNNNYPVSIVANLRDGMETRDLYFAKVVTGVSLPNTGGSSIEGFWADKEFGNKSTNTKYTASFLNLQPAGTVDTGDIVWIGFRFGINNESVPCKASFLCEIDKDKYQVSPFILDKSEITILVKGKVIDSFVSAEQSMVHSGFAISSMNAYRSVVDHLVSGGYESNFSKTLERLRKIPQFSDLSNSKDGVTREKRQFHAKRTMNINGKNYTLPDGMLFLTQVSGVWLIAIQDNGGSKIVTMDYLADRINDADKELSELVYQQSKALEALAMSYKIIALSIEGKE